MQVGLFDNPQNIQAVPFAADAAVAQELEESGAVTTSERQQPAALERLHHQVHRRHQRPRRQVRTIRRWIGPGSTQRRGLGSSNQSLPAMLGSGHLGSVVATPGHSRPWPPSATVTFNRRHRCQAAAAALAKSVSSRGRLCQPVDQRGHGSGPASSIGDLTDADPITYPESQDGAGSNAVVAANPNTIVVLENGGPVLMFIRSARQARCLRPGIPARTVAPPSPICSSAKRTPPASSPSPSP